MRSCFLVSHRLYAVALLAVSLCFASPAWASFEDGLKAYDVGDMQAAVRHWRPSAQSGDARAQFRLGQMCDQGVGTVQNWVQAHVWYNLAASQGNQEAAQARSRIAKLLTPDQLADAQRQAAAFQPSSGPSTSGRSNAEAPAVSPVTMPSVATARELYKAAEAGDVAKIHDLLAQGAKINEPDPDGWTAIFFATGKGQTEAVKALIEAKADVNARGKRDSETPLMVAVLTGSPEIVKMLVGAKADQNAKDRKGRTARELAEIKGQQQVVGLLKPVIVRTDTTTSTSMKIASASPPSQSKPSEPRRIVDKD